jgi:acetolactate synthase-1/2/3 large subunit
VYANYAVDQADLLIALGVRFDDRVTGRLEAFAQRARIVHIDIDAAEIGKNKVVHTPVRGGGDFTVGDAPCCPVVKCNGSPVRSA